MVQVYCFNATSQTSTGWHPTQLECDGSRAVEFYSALLSFGVYWNRTWQEEGLSCSVQPVGLTGWW